MSPLSVDEWMDHFVSEVAPDNDPRDVPSASERKAVSDYLHGSISVGGAANTYTRDTISENTTGDVWYLIYHIAQSRPETQDHLIELVRAISALLNESRTSGKVQSWGPATLADLHGDLRDHWDGQSNAIRVNPATASHREFVDLTIFIARLRSEGLLRTDYFTKAVMLFALESEESVQVLDTYLLATARYLEWVVQDVFTESHKECVNPGPLLKKAREDGDMTRWQFWKSRMAVLGDDDRMSKETRDAAKASLARMVEVESVAAQ